MKPNIDHPTYTAYVLGELTPKERAAIDREIEQSPELRQHIDELRAFANELTDALQHEPVLELDAAARQTIIRASRRKPEAKLFRLPVWTITSVSAAAAALVVAFFGFQHAARQADLREQRLAAVDESRHWPRAEEYLETIDLDELVMLDQPLQFKPAEKDFAFDAETPPVDVMEMEIAYDFAAPAPETEFAQLGVMAVQSPLSMQGYFSGRSEARSVARRQYGGGMREFVPREPAAPAFLSPSLDDFPELRDNRFVRVEDHPLSTFSIDVDTASYAVMRTFLNEGRMPPPDAIRVEELINYFPYQYAPPTDDVPFAAHLAAGRAPWNTDHHLVRIALKGRELTAEARPPLNLVFLIDTSGSMHPANRLPLVVRSLQALTRQLDERDHVAIVVYAGTTGLHLSVTRGDQTQDILDALGRLRAGGATAGGAGIQLAYEVAKEHFNPEAMNRVILCTDGDFNVGITQRGELERFIEEKAKTGVFLTVLGYGMGNYKDSTLEVLSNKGNGNYAYIDDFSEARKVLVDQMLGTLVTIAKDVKIQVEFNPAHVAGYRLIGYENRMLRKEDFNNDRVDAGDIGAGHTVTAFYEIIPAGRPVTDAPGVDELKYQRPSTEPAADAGNEVLTVKLRYKEPDGDVSSKLDFVLDAATLKTQDASADFRFATAVAAFGQLLRRNEHVQPFTFEQVLELAETALNDDPAGHRAEFRRLVRNAKAIAGK